MEFWSYLTKIRTLLVSWEYSCDEELLEEFNERKTSKYFSLPAVLPRIEMRFIKSKKSMSENGKESVSEQVRCNSKHILDYVFSNTFQHQDLTE